MTVQKRSTPEKSYSQKTVSSFMASSEKKKQTSLLSFFAEPKKAKIDSLEKRADDKNQSSVPNSPLMHRQKYEMTAEEDDEEDGRFAIPAKSSRKSLRIESDDEDIISETNMQSIQSEPNGNTLNLLENFSRGSKIENPFSTPQPTRTKAKSKIAAFKAISEEIEDRENGDERYSWLVDMKDKSGNTRGHPDYNPRTLFIPNSQWNKFTPFEKQYWEIKSDYFDTIVFFKKGKFYELYETDADIGSKEFDLKMTDRVNMRMAGVPEASFEYWAAKFIAAGHKVAKVDQMETSIGKSLREKTEKPAKADKIIKRNLSCILTAGTLMDPVLISSQYANFCLSIKEIIDGKSIKIGVCLIDTSTCTIYMTDMFDEQDYSKLATLLAQTKVKEIFYEKGKLSHDVVKLFKQYFSDSTIQALTPLKEFWDNETTFNEVCRFSSELMNNPVLQNSKDLLSFSAFGALYWYLRSLKLDESVLSQAVFKKFDPIQELSSLVLDHQTLSNLEIFQNTYDGTETGSLFQLIDHCSTAFGKRLLKQWVCHPSRDVYLINQRLDIVSFLLENGQIARNQFLTVEKIALALTNLPDLERLVSRIGTGNAKLKDFLATLDAFHNAQKNSIEALKMESYLPEMLSSVVLSFPDLDEKISYFKKGFDYSSVEKDGFIVPFPQAEKDYDDILYTMNSIKSEFQVFLEEQKKILRTNNLKYKDIGKELFQLEVPSNIKVPDDYMLMSKTKTVNRYWTSKLKNLVQRYQEADEIKTCTLSSIFSKLMKKFSADKHIWLAAVESLAKLDCFLSLTKCSRNFGEPICRPEFVESEESFFECTDLRHPCVSRLRDQFVSNDINIGGENPGFILLTGPNMGGKSTLLRQTCIAIILSQLGIFVPATSCRLTVFDRVFTRIGANDNIAGGQSTFMIELRETCRILKESTKKSFVILDELGRGTSTFDGLAIAYATLHYLTRYVGCLGMFSTHYQLLAKDFEDDPYVNLCYMACETISKKDITFLYKLTKGSCLNSFGINVAALAGIPTEVIELAECMAEKISISDNSLDKSIGVSLRKLFDYMVLIGEDQLASNFIQK